MEQEIIKKIENQENKINAILKSVEKTRKYFLVTMWVTIIVFVLPLVGLLLIIPSFINNYLNSLQGLI